MEFADRILKCVECGAEFVFSSGEQAFFSEKQFTNDPKRCKGCRGKDGSRRTLRPDTHVKCSECGVDTTVPFKPTQGRPVLCRACFQKVRSAVEMPPTIDPERTTQAKQRSLKSAIPFRQSKIEP
jgi:CxxC-x17-CxxC domain-containing protein